MSVPAHGPDPRPVVRLPGSGLSGAAIAAAALVAAGLLFLLLDTQRRENATAPRTDGTQQVSAFAAPPPLALPPEARDPAPPPAVMLVEPSPAGARAAPPANGGMSPPAPVIVAGPAQADVPPPPAVPWEQTANEADEAQALIIDGGIERRAAAGTSPAGQPRPAAEQRNPLPQGAGLGNDTAPAQATTIRNRTMVVPTGTMIPAVLETPIDTARPGLVRAIVSMDARGFDGRRVLVPRGARLVGEYLPLVQSGQNRVMVNWTRLIRPDGVVIPLSSPAADALGGAGVPGKVHSYFFKRFGAALLQSAMAVGVNIAARPGNGSVIVGNPAGPLNNTVGQGLLPNDIRPKITVKQGAEINVFVARDLDFSLVPAP